MSPADPLALVFSTAPDEQVAQTLSQALVTEGLAACVTALPGATSTYAWEGQLQTSSEVQLLIKTSAARLPRLEERLCALHPYGVPEFLTVDISGGLPAYLDWIREGVSREPDPDQSDPSESKP
jgi:periplasmic divalent cation tolerance protein